MRGSVVSCCWLDRHAALIRNGAHPSKVRPWCARRAVATRSGRGATLRVAGAPIRSAGRMSAGHSHRELAIGVDALPGQSTLPIALCQNLPQHERSHANRAIPDQLQQQPADPMAPAPVAGQLALAGLSDDFCRRQPRRPCWHVRSWGNRCHGTYVLGTAASDPGWRSAAVQHLCCKNRRLSSSGWRARCALHYWFIPRAGYFPGANDDTQYQRHRP